MGKARVLPKSVKFCAIGFAHHVTDYEGDTILDAAVRYRTFDSPWKAHSSSGIGCSGGSCEWESQPLNFQSHVPIIVNVKATHRIDIHSDRPPTSSATWVWD